MKVPVDIRGVIYESFAAAGRAFGVNGETVQKAANNGRLDFVGLGKNKRQTVEIDGQEYSSITKASRATGVPFETLRRRVHRERKAAK